MFAIQFVSQELFPLKRSDASENAMLFMEDWQVKELPVVEAGKIIGMITYNQAFENPGKRVDEFMQLPDAYLVNTNLHIWEVWSKFQSLGLTTVCLQQEDGMFAGQIHLKDISIQSFAHSALMQEGAILVLEVEAIQYSLAEIARICEANQAKIIHLMIEPIKSEANLLQISIKLNTSYPAYVIASLERFSYKVTFSSGFADPNHSFDDRYKWLVKYLNT